MNHLRRTTLAASAAFVMLLAVGACSDDESVFNAEVGECIETIPTGNVSTLDEVDCSDDHEGEIFLLFEHEGDDDDFPGPDALSEEAAEDCLGDEFEDYVGVPYAETAIEVQPLFPTEDSWSEGDRETVCILSIGEAVDESFEGNGEDYPLGEDEATTDTTGGDGEEQDFSALIEDCEGGDMAACDDLYYETPVGSEEERIGSTCGGRSEEELVGACEETFG
jgi:Septum formation